MAYVQKPCVCGGRNFHVLPNIPVSYWPGTSTRAVWSVSAVVCTACGRTETFTHNPEEVAANLQGARMIAAGES
jgi:hypothetical protein